MLIARSVLFEVVRNFLGALTATTGVAFFMLCITFLKRTPGIGLGFLVDVFPLFFPMALQFTLPLAVLTGVVMTFSRMAQDGEVTALAAAGIPIGVFARPVLAWAAIIAVLGFGLTDLAAPFAAGKLRQARRDIIHQLQTAFRSGLCDLDFGRGRISFQSFHGSEFKDLCLEWHRADGAPILWRAERGSISVTDDDRVVIALENAQEVLGRKTKHGEVSIRLGRAEVERSLGDIVGDSTMRRKRTGLQASELAYVARRGIARAPGTRLNSLDALEELARRTALSAAVFFFALIGIPLGLLSARGGRVGALLFGIGPVLIVYFPLVLLAANVGRRGTLPAFPALWTGNVLLLVVGLALLRRAGRR